jgi:integrase
MHKVRVLTLAARLYPDEWDEKDQKIIAGEDGTQRRRYLDKAVETLKEYRKQFEEVTGHLEKKGRYNVNDIIIGCPSRRGLSSLYGFTNYLAVQLEKSGQGRTASAYRSAVRAFIRFNKGADIPLKHINSCIIREFETGLKDKGLFPNTISYYMRMLRTIYNKAVRERIIEAKSNNPFEGVFTGFQETRKRALNVEQLRKLNNIDFSALLENKKNAAGVKQLSETGRRTEKGLYDSWRFFFFCFHARGMSFVDMAYLRKENIRQGVISYYRKKTGQMIDVTVTGTLKQIIDSFAEEVKFSPYVFPVIRDPDKPHRLQYETGLHTQNRRLKKLAVRAELNTDCGLSTHVSRHSWATTGKIQNLPLSVISEGLGHKSEKTTTTYLASFDRTTMDKASEKIDMAVISPQGMAYISVNS